MPDGKMNMAWSESRVKTLRDCRRRYWYHYFGSDGGWFASATPECKKIYMLKQMTNLPMLAGTLVHDVIAKILMHQRNYKKPMPYNKAEKMVIDTFRSCLKESIAKGYQKKPKACNLAEHYYGPEPTKDDMLAWRDKILRCLNGFYKSWACEAIHDAPVEKWIDMEQFRSFYLKTGESVGVKLDFAFYDQSSVANIIDWKTGKPNDTVSEQMIVYAMYAMKELLVPFDKIWVLPVFLDDPEHIIQPVPVFLTIESMKKQAAKIAAEYRELKIAEKDRGDSSQFPTTENPRICAGCPYREICDDRPR